MDKLLKFKSFEFEMKEVDEGGMEGKFAGYASTFGNIDYGLDVVDKGAFKVTLRDSKGKIPILADHSPYDQIGWNEKAKEDEKGLYVEGSIDLNVQKGRERFSLAKKALSIGAKMGLSIGYLTIKAEPNKDNPRVRHLKELKLFEYSLVTFPMNVEAMVTGAKSLVGVDRATFFLEQLKAQGVTMDDLQKALELEAALEKDPDTSSLLAPQEGKSSDPALSQSLESFINSLKI